MMDIDYDKTSEYIYRLYFKEVQDFKISTEQIEQYRELQLKLVTLKEQETSELIKSLNSNINETFNTLDSRSSGFKSNSTPFSEVATADQIGKDAVLNRSIKSEDIFNRFKDLIYTLVENLNDIIDYILNYWL